jgi:TonB family protein
MLVGKTFYLRSGYLDDSLAFNEHGGLSGHSPQGSYTLNMVEIAHVRLTKHKVELEGVRYGLHFLGALPSEDPATAVDKVRITPNKKALRITIDRELVVKPKAVKAGKVKEAKPGQKPAAGPALPTTPAESPTPATYQTQATVLPVAETAASATEPADSPAAEVKPESAAANGPASPSAVDAAPESANASGPAQPSEALVQATDASAQAPETPAAAPESADEVEAKAEMAAAPEAERPADPTSVTTTLSPAHATQVLKDALDKIFAPGLDDRIKASLPEFWKLYYQAAAQKADYTPSDPAVLQQSEVDKKARLLSTFEPQSNQFAQDNGVAGMALYHAVIGADGKPGEIAVARPIGFGLDENAVQAIQNAKFEPAIKNGQPVPVLLDLAVQFRIYSNRTSAPAAPETADKSGDHPAGATEPSLPGPFTIRAHQ